jgi:aminopeptidase C
LTRPYNAASVSLQTLTHNEMKSQKPLFNYCFNPQDNGGEFLFLSALVEQDGTDEPFVTQEITLNSYCNSATFQINCYLTPEKLRDCANKLESFLITNGFSN